MMFMTSETLALGRRFINDGQITIHLLGKGTGPNHTTDVGRDHHQVGVGLLPDVCQDNWRGVNIVNGDIKKPLDLIGVQVHREYAIHPNALQHVRHHFWH